MWRKDVVCSLMWAFGLAAAAVGILLWGAAWTNAGASSWTNAGASSWTNAGALSWTNRTNAKSFVLCALSGAPLDVEAVVAAEAISGAASQTAEVALQRLYQGSVGGAWNSTTPVTTVVSRNEYQVWPITRYGVTVTFYANSVPLDLELFPGPKDNITPLDVTAVFTFTPRDDVILGLGVVSSHVFDLEGRYSWGGVVSVNDYDIALQYSQDDLGEIIEPTLHFYHYDPFARAWSQVQPGSLDVRRNVVACTTDEMGLFAVAGTRFQVYLPLALGD